MQGRAAEHEVGSGLPGLARSGDQVPGIGNRSQGRSAVTRQQDDHGHRSADRHHGLDRRALYGGDQGAADGGHRVLEFGRLLWRRTQVRRLGHDHLRGQVAQAGLSLHRERQGRVARRRTSLGPQLLGDRRNDQARAAGSAGARVVDRPRGRERSDVRLCGKRPAPCSRALRRGRGDGLEEPEGSRAARHQGRVRHSRFQGLHEGDHRRQEGAGG